MALISLRNDDVITMKRMTCDDDANIKLTVITLLTALSL